MKQIEENVMNSFRLAKTDIITLNEKVIDLNESQKRIISMFKDISSAQARLDEKVKHLNAKSAKPVIIRSKPIVRTVTKSAKKVFVASKQGKKFHEKNCPFAQNIKPKSRMIFNTKSSPLNKGYKACNCVK
ncbi:MAG: hypothetical protein ABII01_04840 [Candidatus Woesearchaeota archaeon]